MVRMRVCMRAVRVCVSLLHARARACDVRAVRMRAVLVCAARTHAYGLRAYARSVCMQRALARVLHMCAMRMHVASKAPTHKT